MLDTETKRKIDSARDILVGKVPDPKAQVEQITTALIYKFMDDMDREAEELGGKAKFITGELEAYQWANLMSKELSGEARLNLYMSALLVFSKAQNIPDIFRTIFKDAFLPYRDPETLNLFLKEINYFDYDHSENLGNAFEYLLSVLGSQGDAGQFRTPRHIIDFIVEIIEPKKTDTILDPSCGTAGFLISAYKHILANETLAPEDKKRLMENFTGYDISPDMVRLSLVNLYLHSFPSPKVYEYDTLTSDDRWEESYNIILANPPFMTPKGGIRPHNRFSVQAKRSEVLFVDYIAEHLNLNGKAGIIVPEGIIFQSANAYKALRKMLVDNGFLWAVVSLPAGVFQPYSGVKTSILLLDRAIAKKHDSILFIKINQDGYDLGAQRRENTQSELPIALELLKTYRAGGVVDNALAMVVLKAKVAETGDYNLTGERYRETVRHENLVYPMVKLGEISHRITKGTTPTSIGFNFVDTGINFIKVESVSDGMVFLTDKFACISEECHKKLGRSILKEGDVLFSIAGALGRVIVVNKSILPANTNQAFSIISPKEDINQNYLAYLLKSNIILETITSQKVGVAQFNLSLKQISELEIPLPPLEIQNAIVAEIEQWQKVIDGAKQVIANYRPTITINPDWEMVKLSHLSIDKIKSGRAITKSQYVESGNYKFVNINELYKNYSIDVNFLPQIEIDNAENSLLKKGDILFVRVSVKEEGAVFTSCFLSDETNVIYSDNILKLSPNTELLNPQFAVYVLRMEEFRKKLVDISNRANLTSVNGANLSNFEIPLPPLETQNTLVEQIEKERAAVDACKTLITLFEAKIKTKIAEVWGKITLE